MKKVPAPDGRGLGLGVQVSGLRRRERANVVAAGFLYTN